MKQIRVGKASPRFWRVAFDNWPLTVVGPEFVAEFAEVMTAIEGDGQLRVVVFDSALAGCFPSHRHFAVNAEEGMCPRTTASTAWLDILGRIGRAPVVSIAKIRGRATRNGSEIAMACDMCFASREKALLPQWDPALDVADGGGRLARLPRLLGAARALEVLMSSDDIRRDLAATYNYVNRSLPDEELDAYVDGLAVRISSFDRLAICNAKRLVNAVGLAPDAWRH